MIPLVALCGVDWGGGQRKGTSWEITQAVVGAGPGQCRDRGCGREGQVERAGGRKGWTVVTVA